MKKKVLIIENDQDIRHIVAYILEEHGFEVMNLPEPENLLSTIPFTPAVILVDEFINQRPGYPHFRRDSVGQAKSAKAT